DGSRAQISTNWSPVVTIEPAFSAVLEKNRLNELQAKAVIPGDSPAFVRVALKELPELSTLIPVSAKDGLPSVSLQVPGEIEPTQELIVKARASDDVGVARVQFLLDGALMATRPAAPYGLVMPASEEMEGRTLALAALVTDTLGQTQRSPDHLVQVKARPKAQVPEFTVEYPVDGQRAVEKTPLVMQVSSSLGTLPDVTLRSGISYVEF